jgi:flagellar biosynthesis protein FlhF
MEYKKYRANTLREAKLKMLLDVGKRGYIVNQKTVKEGGFLGLFGKPMVEITVNVLTSGENGKFDSNNDFMDTDFNFGMYNNNGSSYAKSKGVKVNTYDEMTNIDQYRAALNRIREIGLKLSSVEEGRVKQGAVTKKELPLDNQNESRTQEVLQENNYLKEEIENLKKMIIDKKEDDNKDVNPNTNKDKETDKKHDKIISILNDYDFNKDIINKYIDITRYEDLNEEIVLKNIVKDFIENNLKLIDGIDIDKEDTKAIALIGPTGVGKTTTLAKLGAYYGVIQDKKVKFISMDNYRVGAVQQLKIYSEIMEIPFAKVKSEEELQEELDYDNYDLILIDTAGRSQKVNDDIMEIKKYLDNIKDNLRISLVISSTTKYKDLLEIMEKFSALNYDNLIATKLDETNSFGQVLSALLERDLTLSYVSFGQSVPEHLKSATKMNLLETLFSD